MKPILLFFALGLLLGLGSCAAPQDTAPATAATFEILLPDSLAEGPLDGRLLLLLSKNEEEEPRFQIVDGPTSQLAFGMDVNGWQPGTTLTFATAAVGYPLANLADIPPGDYHVQILLHKYETFTRSDDHTVKLPMDRGEGQQWNLAPGNLLNAPQKLSVRAGQTYELAFDRAIPAITPPEDTEWVKPSASAPNGSANSGAATCTWARTCCCPRAGPSIPR
jgi:hypothetical protein